MIVSFVVQKILSFMASHLPTVNRNACTTRILFRKSFLVPLRSSLFPPFSAISFKVTGLVLRPWVYLEYSFVQSEGWECCFILLHVAIQFDWRLLLKMLCFLHCVFLTPSSKIRRLEMCLYFWLDCVCFFFSLA